MAKTKTKPTPPPAAAPVMRDDWTQAAVGLHWTRRNYSISTLNNAAVGGRYIVVRHPGEVLGQDPTWEAAVARAAKHEADRLGGPCETVADLIAVLQELPQDARPMIDTEEHGFCGAGAELLGAKELDNGQRIVLIGGRVSDEDEE